ncbi:hypothetical protein, conserved [Angomonas deanei]|uniref:Uncharacterized protein n=1 Tax=Angomonas deanei TaxID=59799 RepID=A0A7G2CFL6_9TRYP|nr:hypothetical protein, conserved [Angomonas deanei]
MERCSNHKHGIFITIALPFTWESTEVGVRLYHVQALHGGWPSANEAYCGFPPSGSLSNQIDPYPVLLENLCQVLHRLGCESALGGLRAQVGVFREAFLPLPYCNQSNGNEEGP